MHRIDAADHVNNLFSEGDAQQGIPGTKVSADWLNAVQEELVAVLTAAGVSPVKADNAQLAAAVTRLFGSSVAKTSDQTSSSGAAAAITGLAFPLEANGIYEWEAQIAFLVSAGTAIGFGYMNAPTPVNATMRLDCSAATTNGQTVAASGTAQTALLTVEYSAVQGPRMLATLRGIFHNGPVSGDFTVGMSTTGGTVYRGSFLRYRKIG